MLEVLGRAVEVSVDTLADQLRLPVADMLVRVVGLEAAGLVDFDGATVRPVGR